MLECVINVSEGRRDSAIAAVAAAAGARVDGSSVAQVLIAAIRSYQSQTPSLASE